MIARGFLSFIFLSLAVVAQSQALEVGDAVTPLAEAVIEVDTEGVEWVINEADDEPAPIERRSGAGGRCRRLEVRKEWRDLRSSQKRKYIEAVKCLMNTPSWNSTFPAKFTRFDDHVVAHSEVADEIHGVAQFLPWHRHFGYLYHKSMKEVCGYKGPAVYWNWARDTNGELPIAQSPLFAEDGFGGGGEPGTYTLPDFAPDGANIPLSPDAFTGPDAGCIKNGPFKDVIVHFGPNPRQSDHCIVRNFLEEARVVLVQSNIKRILSQANYNDLSNSISGLPYRPVPELHDGGHGFVRGDMGSFYTSNNDPIFYPHHAGVDRLWWRWQSANLRERLHQVQGPTSPYEPFGAITLDTNLPFTGFSADVRTGATMDPRREPYCYTY